MSRNLVRLAIAILGCTSIIFLCFRGFVLSHETIQIQEAKSVLEECHEAYLDYIMSNNINANEYPEINDFFKHPFFYPSFQVKTRTGTRFSIKCLGKVAKHLPFLLKWNSLISV